MAYLARVLVVAAMLLPAAVRADDSGEAARQVVDRWLAAQNQGRWGDYQALYATQFHGIRRSGSKTVALDRAGWLHDRRRMFKSPMKVAIDKLAIEHLDAGTRVRFVQSFESGRYRDEGDKELLIVDKLIVREELLTSTRPGADGTACDELRCKDTSTPAVIVAACERACQAGNAGACREEAVMLELATCGLARDPARANSLREKACGPEDPMSCTNAADAKLAADPAGAAALFRLGCDNGDPAGCYHLAQLLLEGTGVARDVAQAVKLLDMVCDEYARSGPGGMSCHDLEEMYAAGKGVKRDRALAREYHRKYLNATEGGVIG